MADIDTAWTPVFVWSVTFGFSHRAVMGTLNTKNGKDLPKAEKPKEAGAGIFFMK